MLPMQAAGSAQQAGHGSPEWDAAVAKASLPLGLEILKALTLHHQVWPVLQGSGFSAGGYSARIP